jgi:hypothetical protein
MDVLIYSIFWQFEILSKYQIFLSGAEKPIPRFELVGLWKINIKEIR